MRIPPSRTDMSQVSKQIVEMHPHKVRCTTEALEATLLQTDMWTLMAAQRVCQYSLMQGSPSLQIKLCFKSVPTSPQEDQDTEQTRSLGIFRPDSGLMVGYSLAILESTDADPDHDPDAGPHANDPYRRREASRKRMLLH
ncbi:hypothetical protein BDV12DRAFT_171685 [Aspergillus spectabilis]